MGLIMTIFFVPESKGMSLEEFEGEVGTHCKQTDLLPSSSSPGLLYE
jgi:hypothetical protein